MTTAEIDEHSDRVKKAHEVVAEKLRNQIVSGELGVGERLPPEEELTAQFGIARTTLREALRVLESQGLLEIRRGRGGGPVVTHPDLAPLAAALAIALQLQGTTVGDLDEARRMIEPQAAGKLALSHREADIDALNTVIDRAATAAEANDIEGFAIAVYDVHQTLLERSGNQTMATISKMLHQLVAAYYTRSSEKTNQKRMRKAVRSYRRLVDHIVAGDHDAAVAHWKAQMAFTIAAHDQTEPLKLYG